MNYQNVIQRMNDQFGFVIIMIMCSIEMKVFNIGVLKTYWITLNIEI